MKSIILAGVIALLIVAVAPSLSAQSFEEKYRIHLPDSITSVAVEPADVNNDGLIDLILFAATNTGREHLLFVKGDTTNGPELLNTAYSITGYRTHMLRDFDLDNALDVLISLNDGTAKSVVLKNTGAFTFEEVPVNLPAFQIARFADLDSDGKPEAIVSGETDAAVPFTRTYKMNDAFDWQPEHDTLKIKLNTLEVLDLDGNGFPDVFYSGTTDAGVYSTALLIQEEGKFIPHHESALLLSSLICDRDTNGSLDIIAYGETNGGVPVYKWFPKHADFNGLDLSATGKLISAFHADLDSDGIPDFNHVTVNGADTVNTIDLSANGEQTLSHKGWRQQRFFDMEHDGDLDIIQVSESDDGKQALIFLDNTTPVINRGPGRLEAFAFPVYDRIFIYWDRVSDDHTVEQSLTYDIMFDGNLQRDVNFDLENGKRLRSEHGNNGTNNFYLLKGQDPFGYAIQPVDNSLYAEPQAICIGSGLNCGEVGNEVVTACSEEKVKIESGAVARWYSFSKGFLDHGSSLEVEANKNDTLFYVVHTSDCPVVRMLTFAINDDVTKTESSDLFVCKSENVTLEVNTVWQDIQWSSEKQGVLGTSTSIAYQTDEDDVVKAVYKNEQGCTIEEQFVVTISIPEVQATPDVHRMMKGQSVNLNATGGEEYSWAPATGLNNASISNPVATPGQDTEYTVTVTDSIGCTGIGKVMLFIEATGFIPSLFTPNGDGQNDALKVYGLADARDFSLRIFNREGSVVYKTSNVNEALTQGWDGLTNGVQQPNGVYYWKVEGALPSGRKLLLNGKEEGSLVLLR